VGAAATFAAVDFAGASTPTQGSIVPDSAVPVGTYTAGTPFSSGQQINVVVPANNLFSPTTNLNVLECAAPGGVVPTSPSACDGNTISGPTLKANTDGSVNFQTYTNSLYVVYALPDSINLGESSSQPVVCNVNKECVLYIGYNQADFTQPHVWSQPFYVMPDSGDMGENPGDGSAPPPPTSVSGMLSTVVASPTTVTADGVDQSTVTVTLEDSGGTDVSGKSVSLSQGSSSHSSISDSAPGSNVTNSNGQTVFTVTDATAETATYTATDTTDTPPVVVSNTARVTFQTPAVDNASSQVVANPTTVLTGGSTTITVTLRDQGASPQPIVGDDITLSQSKSAGIEPTTPVPTNSAGVATFTATDSVAEDVTFTAKDITESVTLSEQPSVQFGVLIVSPSKSTVTVGSPAPMAPGFEAATVTLLSTSGSPVAGKTVTLTATGSATITPGATPDVTNAAGQATFEVKDTVAESVTLTATDTTDSPSIVLPTAQVTFQASAPSATDSTITESSNTGPADGVTPVLIIVNINDQFGNPLAGKTVTLQNSSTSGLEASTPIADGSSQPGVTDAEGQAEFEVSDEAAETVTFSATDTTDNISVTGDNPPSSSSVAVAFTSGPADANQSTTTSNPTQVAANGTQASTITVNLFDHFGNAVANNTIAISALNGSSVITQVDPVTNANGQATFTVTDITQEVVTYSLTDTSDNLLLGARAVVIFGNPPVPPPVPADSVLLASPTSLPADGTTTGTITVLMYDGNANAVEGKSVTLTASGGSSKITAVSAVTDNDGTATFNVSDSTPETVSYTATDTTDDNLVLTGDAATVTFTPVAPAPTAATSGGSTASTVSTTSVPPASSASAGSGSDNSGSVATSAVSSGATLATTGVPPELPWLLGSGLLFLIAGSCGRRIALRRAR
jgi:hypothetical protein